MTTTPWVRLRDAVEGRRRAAAEEKQRRRAREEQIERELTAAGEIYRRGVDAVPALPPEPPGPEFSPRYLALIAEVQQLRLMRTPAGQADLARRLRTTQEHLAAVEDRRLQLQRENESLYAQLQDRGVAEHRRRLAVGDV